jgi:MYXO-CTERM domain-containing protein
MQSNYGNAGDGYQGMSLWTGAGLGQGWRNLGINADLAPYSSLDGLWTEYDGSAAWPNQAYFRPNDRNVQLQYMTQPGGGSFEIRKGADGDVQMTVSTDGPAGEIRTLNYTMPDDEYRYTIQPKVDGPLKFLGQNNLSDNAGVRIHRAANGGWGVQNFLQRDGSFDKQLQMLDTDLVMVWLGQNDQGYNRTSYASKLNQLVDRIEAASPDAELVLIGTYDQGSVNLAPLVDAMADVAAARDVGFMNLYLTAGNRAFFDTNGYVADGVHFTHAGGQYLGEFLYRGFISDGATLVPEPTALTLLGLGAIVGLRRRK